MGNLSSPQLRIKQRLGGSPWADRAADLGQSAKSAVLNAADAVATKAGPTVEAAIEWASPRVESAWTKSVAAAAPRIEEAAKALAPRVDDARDLIVERALPAIVTAAEAAARSATGAQLEAARVAKRGRLRRIVVWSALGAAAAGVALWFWRQTRPVTDPWAEEEWDEFEVPPEEDLSDAAGDAVEAVGEAAGHAVKAVADAAKKAGDAMKRAGDAVKKTAESDDDDREGEEPVSEDQAGA